MYKKKFRNKCLPHSHRDKQPQNNNSLCILTPEYGNPRHSKYSPEPVFEPPSMEYQNSSFSNPPLDQASSFMIGAFIWITVIWVTRALAQATFMILTIRACISITILTSAITHSHNILHHQVNPFHLRYIKLFHIRHLLCIIMIHIQIFQHLQMVLQRDPAGIFDTDPSSGRCSAPVSNLS